jgi:hypothetical protein
MLIFWIVLVTVFPRCIWVCVLFLLFRHRQALIIKGQEDRHQLMKQMQNNAIGRNNELVDSSMQSSQQSGYVANLQ